MLKQNGFGAVTDYSKIKNKPMKKTEILKELISLSGLNQKQFSERHEIDKTRLNRLLKGVWDIRTPELENIALKEGYLIKWNYELISTN